MAACSASHSHTPAFLENDEGSEPRSPAIGNCPAGIAALVEHNGHPTRNRRWQLGHSPLKSLQRAGEQIFFVVDGQHHTHGGHGSPSMALAHRRFHTSKTNSASLWWTAGTRPGVRAMIS